MCLSKGLTSGTVPLAVTLTTEEIYGAFYDDYEKGKTFYHGHTFTANAVGCAAGLASLEIFEEEKTLEHVEGLIPILHKGMEKLRELRFVGDVRCIGMVGAVELVRDKETKEAFGAGERRGYEVFKAGLSEHLILRPLGDVIYLVVPLSITREELEDILSRTYKVISGLGG
jgi:adenosylmethionine-8-amino-7-oxononanoate aminotransferase